MMSTMHSKRQSSLARMKQMTDQLREQIQAGKYVQGTFLPSELELGKQYDLSNKSVRKVLEQLRSEGLIEKIPRIGSMIKVDREQEPITLRLGCMFSVERDMKLSLLIEDFQRQHPYVRIQTVPIFCNLEAAQQYLTSGFLDAFTLHDEFFRTFVESSLTSELLEPLVPQELAYPFLNEFFSVGDNLYAHPLVFSPVVLAYNTDHFRQAGVLEPDGSWTWHNAVRHAARLSVPGERYGLYFHPLAENRWPVFLLQSGMGLCPGADGHCRIAGTSMLECLRMYKSILRNKDIFPTDHFLESNADIRELFQQGKVSMTLTTYSALNDLSAGCPPYDISPVPYMYEPRTLLTMVGIAVNRHSGNKTEAVRFANYLSSMRAQQLIRDNTLSIPSLKPVAESISAADTLPRPARFHMFRDIMSSYRRQKDLQLSTAGIQALHNVMKKYGSDLIDDEAVCQEIDTIAVNFCSEPDASTAITN